jgi:hypothetical protein
MTFDEFIAIFSDPNLRKIDDNRISITDTKYFKNIVKIMPKLEIIFSDARDKDEFECNRTIRHTLRILTVYFLILNGEFKPPGKLPKDYFNIIRDLIAKINNINNKFLPAIFLLHDIGKPFNQRSHPKESAKIIEKYNLLDYFNFEEKRNILVKKVIEYHLMMGTINNGESSLWALINFIKDKETSILIDEEKLLDLYLDVSVVFAVLDVYGYGYGIVNSNYIDQYFELKNIFKKLLIIEDKEEFYKTLDSFCFERIDWRLSSALRIFQYYNSTPVYSKEFFIERIWDAINRCTGDIVNSNNWDDYKIKKFTNTSRVQLMYGLPIMMRLAMSFERRSWKIDENLVIKTDLIDFWLALNNRINVFLEKSDGGKFPIQVVWKGLPHWSQFDDNIFNLLKGESISKIIMNSKIEQKQDEYDLILDFEKYL